jgi:hypothetical protein
MVIVTPIQMEAPNPIISFIGQKRNAKAEEELQDKANYKNSF